MGLIAGYKTYNTVHQTCGHVRCMGYRRGKRGGKSRRLENCVTVTPLEVEFWLACIDPVIRQRGAEVIHRQSRPRLILWRVQHSVSCYYRQLRLGTYTRRSGPQCLVGPGTTPRGVGADASVLVSVRSDVGNKLLSCQ